MEEEDGMTGRGTHLSCLGEEGRGGKSWPERLPPANGVAAAVADASARKVLLLSLALSWHSHPLS